MTKFDLASRTKRPSKRPIPLAKINPTQAQAASLFAIYAKVIDSWLGGNSVQVLGADFRASAPQIL